MSKLRLNVPLIEVVLGLWMLIDIHLLWLREAPGLHFDEAWAANFSARIATEPGFFPFQAMSPYTSAWAHYGAAALFKLAGEINLWTYRLSGVLFVLAGVLLCMGALWRIGEKRAATLLPFLVCAIPGLLLNHRFVIEITTFHVFTFGLLFLGLARWKEKDGPWLVAAGTLFGVTSHILFIAPALGAIAALFLMSPQGLSSRTRVWISVTLLPLIAFFAKIALTIPEKDKSVALLGLSIAILAAIWTVPRTAFSWLAGVAGGSPRLRVAGLLLCLPFFTLLAFFAEGSWSATYFTGQLNAPIFAGVSLILPALILFLSFRRDRVETRFDLWFVLTLIVTAAIAVKPTPRYFELPLFMGAIFLSIRASRLSNWILRPLLVAALVGALLPLGANFWMPIISGEAPIDRDFRFLIFHDSSSDALSKQELVYALSSKGCAPGGTVSDDPRLTEALHFLAHGDWPASATAPHTCRVDRTRTLTNSVGETNGPFTLR